MEASSEKRSRGERGSRGRGLKKNKQAAKSKSQGKKHESQKDEIRSTFGAKKRVNRSADKIRKKGMPKWKNVVAEIGQLEARLKAETPPTGVHYYKYKSGEQES
jgi:hypothetical protein